MDELTSDNRNALLAAAAILLIFGVIGLYMPAIMLEIGRWSPLAAGIVAILFVAAFFAVFWVRSLLTRKRSAGNDRGKEQ